jgi:hypothetical protein
VVDCSEISYFNMARIGLVVLGALLIVFGLVGVAVLA